MSETEQRKGRQIRPTMVCRTISICRGSRNIVFFIWIRVQGEYEELAMLLCKTVFVLDLVFCYLIVTLKSERYKLPLPRSERAPTVREDTTLTTITTEFATTTLNNIDWYRNASYTNARRSYNRTRFARIHTPFATHFCTDWTVAGH